METVGLGRNRGGATLNLTKENLLITLDVATCQQRLFQQGILFDINEPVGVAPSKLPGARRAVKKGLLEASPGLFCDWYRLTRVGKHVLEGTVESN